MLLRYWTSKTKELSKHNNNNQEQNFMKILNNIITELLKRRTVNINPETLQNKTTDAITSRKKQNQLNCFISWASYTNIAILMATHNSHIWATTLSTSVDNQGHLPLATKDILPWASHGTTIRGRIRDPLP